MLADWNLLSDDLQLVLSREALQRAAHTIAQQAEVLATEMEQGRASPTAAAPRRCACSPPWSGSRARTHSPPRATRGAARGPHRL